MKFKIHTNASKLQLGEAVINKRKSISFYSIKLTYAHKSYQVSEIQLLRTIKNIKEFRTILLGQKSRMYTNHKNLTCKNFNTDRILRWRLILEEYGSDIEYIKGEKNIVADSL